MSDRAPSFELASDDGSTFSTKNAKGKYLLLYFYPKDDTPGCTRQAQAFTAAERQFQKRGVQVVGISRDSVERHRKFREKYGLKLTLLSDPDAEVHKAYGAYGEKKLYGKVSMGALRTTFLIGPGGEIVKRWPNVKVDGHADAVLAELDAVLGETSAKPAAKTAKPAAKKTVKKS